MQFLDIFWGLLDILWHKLVLVSLGKDRISKLGSRNNLSRLPPLHSLLFKWFDEQLNIDYTTTVALYYNAYQRQGTSNLYALYWKYGIGTITLKILNSLKLQKVNSNRQNKIH